MMLNAFLRRGRDRSWANRRKRQQWRLLCSQLRGALSDAQAHCLPVKQASHIATVSNEAVVSRPLMSRRDQIDGWVLPGQSQLRVWRPPVPAYYGTQPATDLPSGGGAISKDAPIEKLVPA